MIETRTLARQNSWNQNTRWAYQNRQHILTYISDYKCNGTSLEILTTYFSQFNKDFDKQIQRFYNEKTLRYLRVSSDVSQTCTYIASSCFAEYRNGTSYEVDILLDETGSIIEAQCECHAGVGPSAHCKHVCTVIFGALHLKDPLFSFRKRVGLCRY